MTDSKFSQYYDAMGNFFNDFDKVITNGAAKRKSQNSDFEIATIGLWRIMSYCVFTAMSDFQDKKKFFAVAGCIRLIMECTADALYLADHQDEAEAYWKNQEKIQEDLMKRKNRWNAFIEGSVNKYGELQDKTLTRIKKMLGKDAMGAYNFLCFYSHPNTASMFWLLNDVEGKTVKFVLQIMTQQLVKFIELVENKTAFGITARTWTERLDHAYSQLGPAKSQIVI